MERFADGPPTGHHASSSSPGKHTLIFMPASSSFMALVGVQLGVHASFVYKRSKTSGTSHLHKGPASVGFERKGRLGRTARSSSEFREDETSRLQQLALSWPSFVFFFETERAPYLTSGCPSLNNALLAKHLRHHLRSFLALLEKRRINYIIIGF